MTDTVRADMLNCYRRTVLQTPNLNLSRLAGCSSSTLTPVSPCAPPREGSFYRFLPAQRRLGH